MYQPRLVSYGPPSTQMQSYSPQIQYRPPPQVYPSTQFSYQMSQPQIIYKQPPPSQQIQAPQYYPQPVFQFPPAQQKQAPQYYSKPVSQPPVQTQIYAKEDIDSKFRNAIERSEKIINTYLNKHRDSDKKSNRYENYDNNTNQHNYQNQESNVQSFSPERTQDLYKQYDYGDFKEELQQQSYRDQSPQRPSLKEYPGGYTYDGELNEYGQRDGYGIFQNQQGQIIYRGDWKYDLYHGNGELYNEDPQILRDSFDYRNMDDIDSYWTHFVGDFRQGTMEGFGSLYMTNGEKLVGLFQDGKAEGQATFYFSNGEILLGIWEQNQFIQEV